MVKIFAEYRILPDKRADYLHFMGKITNKYRNLEVLEGTDQTHLFVEIWQEMSVEEYLSMKKERLESKGTLWDEMNGFVVGGKEKVHIWSFQTIRQFDEQKG